MFNPLQTYNSILFYSTGLTIASCLVLFFIPTSPAYLLRRNKNQKFKNSLKYIGIVNRLNAKQMKEIYSMVETLIQSNFMKKIIKDQKNNQERDKRSKLLDAYYYFKNKKNLFRFVCFFCHALMMYLRAYLFIFLTDRFIFFGIQKVNFVLISAVFLSAVTFGCGFYKMNRRILNFMVSGGMFLSSTLILILSFLVNRRILDICGLIAARKKLYHFWK